MQLEVGQVDLALQAVSAVQLEFLAQVVRVAVLPEQSVPGFLRQELSCRCLQVLQQCDLRRHHQNYVV